MSGVDLPNAFSVEQKELQDNNSMFRDHDQQFFLADYEE